MIASGQTRDAAFQALGRGDLDLLIIGGGINGAAIARDAALRGLRTGLIEQEDFASGTSSRSSRLIHGGLRYLEHGHLHLVFESSRERRILLQTAPHLVHPLLFTWPVYRKARIPKWKLIAGLWLYDALALFREAGMHESLDAGGVIGVEPGLRRDGLVGGARYYDAATDDTRLTLANVLAARAAGAIVLNHAALRGLTHENGRAIATVEDTLTATPHRVAATVVVNATGPWTDEIRRLEDSSVRPAVRGTKGVHIAVPRERVGNREAITLLSPTDGRVMFILPADSHTLIGTTDTSTTERPGEVRAAREDITYLLNAANAFFPAAELGERDVVAAWAGIRPLAAAGFTGSEGGASREHALEWSDKGVLSVTGGKLTTHRVIGIDVVNAVARRLERTLRPSPTASLPISGGAIESIESEVATATPIAGDQTTAVHLVRSYGSEWRAAWARTRGDPRMGERVVAELPYLRAELRYAVDAEMAMTLADVLMRRTHLAFETRDHGVGVAPMVAAVIGPPLGWDAAEQTRQCAVYERDARRVFG